MNNTKEAGGGGECGDHGTLNYCELEAAQTLACLAHSGGDDVEVQVKDKSMVDDSLPGSSGRSGEHAMALQSAHESEFKTSLQSTVNCPPVASRKLKQNLTEEEKEERRLCRVLANRESARQTNRRRQAMYEELTRKAADLASENETLKKKKELAAEEYNSLKNKNTGFREQIAMLEMTKSEETDSATRPTTVEMSSTNTIATSCHNGSPMTPFFWPPIFQPVDSFLL